MTLGTSARRAGACVAGLSSSPPVCLFTVGARVVIVDRVAASRVDCRTAEAFQHGLGTPARPSDVVRGFPVLSQLASGALRHVDITAQDIPARGTSRTG
ncbi:LmeA family phospholipid-binding protein [Streptomyces gardneri]|uniref:LmeA family phospholipid-binding protein n=1 Tax=Streptomyces gardneri TaxID=66892 RepID=UPI0035DAD323